MDEPKIESVFALVILAASILSKNEISPAVAKDKAKELLADEPKKEKRKG